MITFIDIMDAFENKPPELDFILPGGMVAGTVNLLNSPGETGNSFWAIHEKAEIL